MQMFSCIFREDLSSLVLLPKIEKLINKQEPTLEDVLGLCSDNQSLLKKLTRRGGFGGDGFFIDCAATFAALTEAAAQSSASLEAFATAETATRYCREWELRGSVSHRNVQHNWSRRWQAFIAWCVFGSPNSAQDLICLNFGKTGTKKIISLLFELLGIGGIFKV